uniref:Sugar phosphate transporter domain-containing protein n=1 Tax=Brassica campestris TaxID=3711 RepID=M4E0B8_BRACM
MGVDMLLLDSQVCSVPPLEFVTALTVVKKDEDVKVIVAGDDDWLPPSPKVVFDESKELGGESTIKAVSSELKCALHVEEDELMSFTKFIVDAMQEAKVSASNEAEISQNILRGSCCLGAILYNKVNDSLAINFSHSQGPGMIWVLSPKYFNFPLPITLTMIYMGFSGFVAFLLIRVFKVWKNCILAHFCCLHSDAQALMPVATFIMAVICGTDKPRCDVFSNMLLVSVGVVISSYGEIHFNIAGTVYQVTGIFAEALRLVLTQVLLQKKGLTLNPINSLYYIPPCSCTDPIKLLDLLFKCSVCSCLELRHILSDRENRGSNYPALGGVVMYNYIKVKDVKASQLTADRLPDRINKELKMENKSSDKFNPDVGGEIPRVEAEINEEALWMQLGNHAA